MKRLMAVLAISALLACSSKNSDDVFFSEVGALSKEEILARGDAQAEKKHWDTARKYYSFLADSFPNDPLGRQAALKVADSFYRAKDIASLTEAQLRYKDFSNRFPNDPQRAYALLMLGKCSLHKSKGSLRDLTPIREASDSFKLVIELFPTSTHATEATELYARAQEDLARHELEVAQFYVRLGSYRGAANRLEYLAATYPKTQAAEEGRAMLARAREYLATETGSEPSPTPTPQH